MKRLRISPFQRAILCLIRDSKNGCSPGNPNSKCTLYGRAHGFSTAERVTLLRSIRRLLANGMIEDNG